MLETEIDKALNKLEQEAVKHCKLYLGDELDLSEDLSMYPHKRIERIADYLRGLM